MTWVIRKAGVTKTFNTTWTTTWLTSYSTTWTTSWSSTYTSYTYQNTTTYWTSVVQQYAGEGPVYSGQVCNNTTYTTTWQYVSGSSEQCAPSGSCFQSYDAQIGGWYADNCPAGICAANYYSAPNLLGNGVVFTITYYNNQTVPNYSNTSQITSAQICNYNYAPGPVYYYEYYSTSGSTSTIIASNIATANYSQNTSRTTSNNTSQNTSRITS